MEVATWSCLQPGVPGVGEGWAHWCPAQESLHNKQTCQSGLSVQVVLSPGQ